MSGKQLLQYVANQATEEQAGQILRDSGVEFRVGAVFTRYGEDTQLHNTEDDAVVGASMGSITGFRIGEQETSVPAPAGEGVHTRSFTQLGSGVTTTQAVGERGVTQAIANDPNEPHHAAARAGHQTPEAQNQALEGQRKAEAARKTEDTRKTGK